MQPTAMTQDDLRRFSLEFYDAEGLDNTIRRMLSALRKHLDMQVAFIGEFLDGKRIFRFLDLEGASASLHEGASDPLEETYCHRIVNGELPWVIEDSGAHEITRCLDVTRRLGIGAYLGVPIKLSNGKVYGTLCCFKNTPDHSLHKRDLSILKAIAEISVELIEKSSNANESRREGRGRIEMVLASGIINVHAQPIFSMRSGALVGHEALARFPQEPHRPPNEWFAEAASVELGEALEMLAIRNAINQASRLGNDHYLSINVSPEFVVNGALAETLAQLHTPPLVIEITEHVPIKDYQAFRLALAPLRARGVRLAVDDAGAGYSNFHHILELEADIIKLDISLIRSIDCESRKYLLAKAISAFAKAIDCSVVAEGIETNGELEALRELGVDMAQGFLLGRPQPMK